MMFKLRDALSTSGSGLISWLVFPLGLELHRGPLRTETVSAVNSYSWPLNQGLLSEPACRYS
jgi:hypothetical protein